MNAFLKLMFETLFIRSAQERLALFLGFCIWMQKLKGIAWKIHHMQWFQVYRGCRHSSGGGGGARRRILRFFLVEWISKSGDQNISKGVSIIVHSGLINTKIVNYNNWVALFLGSPHILQATESWAGPGNEANNWASSAMCKPLVYVPDIIACDEYLRTEKAIKYCQGMPGNEARKRM